MFLDIGTNGELALGCKGICGSGILDLIAQGYLAGWINGNGTLNPEASERIRMVWDEGKLLTARWTELNKAKDVFDIRS